MFNEVLNIDENDRNRGGVRAQLLFKPSEDFKLRLIADYDKIDEICCSVVNLVDGPTGNAVRALGGRGPLVYLVRDVIGLGMSLRAWDERERRRKGTAAMMLVEGLTILVDHYGLT